MFVQNDILSEFIGWVNKNVLEHKDKVILKFNPYKEEGKLFTKIRLFKGKPKATITISNRIPYLELPSYIIYELGKYVIYRASAYNIDEDDIDGKHLIEKVEELVTRWNDYVDTKYVVERNG